MRVVINSYSAKVRVSFAAFFGVLMEEDEEKKTEKISEVLKTVKPRYLEVFDCIVKSNDGKHLVGGSITWADIYLTHVLQHFQIMLGINVSDDYPALKNLTINVLSTPQIKEWMDKRPQTKY